MVQCAFKLLKCAADATNLAIHQHALQTWYDLSRVMGELPTFQGRESQNELHQECIVQRAFKTVDTHFIFTDTDLRSHFWTLVVDLWTTNRVCVCPVTYK